MYNANYVNPPKALLDSIEVSIKGEQDKLQVTVTFGQYSAGSLLQSRAHKRLCALATV